MSHARATGGASQEAATYLIDGETYCGSSEALHAPLKSAYARRGSAPRPRCLCVAGGVEMYISRAGDGYLLKRMPGSAQQHHCACASYEPPPALSGLGQVLGTAIAEDPADGSTVLKLGFPLTKVGRKAPVLSEGGGAESAGTSGAKLSLRGLLHFLWEQAGLNRWSPAMANKRVWGVVRHHLLLACEGKLAAGGGLAEALLVPEMWDEGRREEQAARRRSQLLRVASASRGSRRLLLLCGEVRKIEPSRYGHRLVVKHAPELEFGLNEDLHKAMRRRFETELAFWEVAGVNGREGHLVALGTFSVGLNGYPVMEELVLMFVTRNWLPVENAFDLAIVEALSQGGHRFTKPLRYNLAASEPLPSAVVTDVGERGCALFAMRPGASGADRDRAVQLAEEAGLDACIWLVEETEMPPLPRRDTTRSSPSPGNSPPGSRFDPWDRAPARA